MDGVIMSQQVEPLGDSRLDDPSDPAGAYDPPEPRGEVGPRRPFGRRRWAVCLALFAVIGVGVLSRILPFALAVVPKEFGDVLWATMFYLWGAFACPRARPAVLAAAALGVCFPIEFLKLYHAPWIDGLREYRPIGFLLGRGFYWHDLACYALGAAGAFVVDAVRMRGSDRWPVTELGSKGKRNVADGGRPL